MYIFNIVGLLIYQLSKHKAICPPSYSREIIGSPRFHRIAPAAPIRKPITPPAAHVSR
nr:MAG TPA: hypothetical protein [Caudoviricetes sp.]